MADLTKDQLRQQNETLFANNNSGNISAEDLRTFNGEVIDTLATELNPSFTGSVEVQGDVSASTYYGDGSNLSGVTSEVPQGTVSGSSQIDYPLISNIPSGIISSSEQLPAGVVSGSSQVIDILIPLNSYTSSNDTRWNGLDAQSGSWVESSITGSSLTTASFSSQTLTFTKGDGTTFGVNIPDVSGSDISSLNQFTQSQEIYNAGINSYTQSTDVIIGNIETYITASSQQIDLIEDFTASQEELNTTFATTGSNFFIGNQDITGSVVINQLSGSGLYPLTLQNPYFTDGKIQLGFFQGDAFSQAEVAFVAANSVFQSTGDMNFNTRLSGGSNTLTFDSQNILINASGSVISNTPQFQVRNPSNTIRPTLNTQFGGAVGLFDSSNSNEINLILKSEDYGYPNNWTGPSISGNNPSDEYPAFIGFQQKSNWTDGTITILQPLDVSGSVDVSGSFTMHSNTLLIDNPTNSQKTTITNNSVKTQDGSGVVQSSLETAYGGKIGLVNLGTSDDFGLTLQAENWGYPPNWSGPAIYSNNPAGEYPAIIGFQNKTNWTDGRVTVLKPLVSQDTLTTTVDVKVGTQLVLLDYANLEFQNDADAATGGVPLGGLYHHNGHILIRTV